MNYIRNGTSPGGLLVNVGPGVGYVTEVLTEVCMNYMAKQPPQVQTHSKCSKCTLAARATREMEGRTSDGRV